MPSKGLAPTTSEAASSTLTPATTTTTTTTAPATPLPSTSTASGPLPSTSTASTPLPSTSAASAPLASAATSALDERQRSVPIQVGECSVKEVDPKKLDEASDDDSSSSSSSSSGDDSESGDVDELDIPSGQSVMDYVASLPGLELRERARILSKVGIEAKRREIAGFVGEATAARMSHLEVKQKFNQLDNWRFTQVGFPNVPPPQFVAEYMKEKEKEKQKEKQEKEKEKRRAERENAAKMEKERIAKEKEEKEADKENQQPSQSKENQHPSQSKGKENQHPSQSKGKENQQSSQTKGKGGRAKRKCAEITERKIKEEAEKVASEVKIVSDVREALKELSDFEASSDSSSDDEWTEKRPNRKQKRKPRKGKKNANAKKLNKTIIFQHDPSHNPFVPPPVKKEEEEEEFDGFGDEEIEKAEALLSQICARYDSLSIVDKKDENVRFGVLPEVRVGTKREILIEKERKFAAALSEGLKLLDDQWMDDRLGESITNMAEETRDILNRDNRELDGPAIDLEDSHEFEYGSELTEIDYTDSEEEEEGDNANVYPHEKAISREQKRFARMLNIGIQKRPARKAASAVKNYVNPEESDIDEEEQLLIPCIYCPDQQHKYGICPSHPDRLPNFIPNSKVDDGRLSRMSRAEASLPANLSIRESRIAGADKGVWYKYCVGGNRQIDKSPLPRGTIFGPYEGRLLSSEEEADRSGTAWEVRLSNGNMVYIDGNDDAEANWLKYVNCSRTAKEQNMYAFDFKGAIYYLTIRQVLPGTELLVYYGDAYADTLNIDVKPNPDKYDEQHCDVCDSFFADEESLSRHVQSEHDGREVWPCDQCSFEGKSEKALLDHARYNHSASFKFHCEVCDYKTNHGRKMENHRRTHDGKRPFSCSICTKGFTQKSHLTRHTLIHSGEKPFKCAECGAAFNGRGNLSRHRKGVHEKLLQFKCDICGKRFGESGHLEKHILTHTGVKPFACSFCDASFAQSSDLKRHVRRHTGEKPFACSKCEASYADSWSLRRHERSKHSD